MVVSFEECHGWQPDRDPCKVCGAGEGDNCGYTESK